MDTTQSRINALSREIGQLMAKGLQQEADKKKEEVAGLKNALAPIAGQLTAVGEELNAAVIRLPNLPAAAVPRGSSPEDNVIVREGGILRCYPRAPSLIGSWQKNTSSSISNWATRSPAAGSPYISTRGRGCNVRLSSIFSITIRPPAIQNTSRRYWSMKPRPGALVNYPIRKDRCTMSPETISISFRRPKYR